MDFIFLKVLSISIIQGVMEWVPISSSGLLIVLEEVLNMNNKIFNFNLNITVHFGSLLAVLFFFSREITKIFNNRNNGDQLRYQKDYDHSYFFVSSFLKDHVLWHKDNVK